MPELPHPTYRLMTEADIDATGYIRKAALEWLARSQGQDPWPWQPTRSRQFAHMLGTDAGGAWVAEIGGTVIGLSMSFVRGDTWFLAQLFVLPEVHGSGAGQGLLERAMAYGREQGARVFAVISSTSAAAQSLYMRGGMFARAVAYQLSGGAERLQALPPPGDDLKVAVDLKAWQDQLAALNAEVWGAERRQDHALFLDGALGLEASEAFALTRGGDLLGYVYVSDTGRIGPMAAWDEADQLHLLRAAADWLVEHEVVEPFAFVLSTNATVAGALLGAGWKVNSWSFLKSSAPFGSMERYTPASGLML